MPENNHKMDRVIFGDNQFFGVNHMSEEKARAQAIRFQDIAAVTNVLDTASQIGIRTFMCTTHERMTQVCDYFRDNLQKYPDYQFYPCMPYAHKYANAVTEQGMIGALKQFLPTDGKISALFKGGKAVAQADVQSIAHLLIDAEMKMFEGLSTPVIFVQNVITDLLLGLGLADAFKIFDEYIRERYNAEPGYITMNLPLLLETLNSSDIENPIICSNINKAAFRMCGGQAAYEKLIQSGRFRPIAMSVFASGAIPAVDAISYVCEQKGIESVVFGASSRGHIQETYDLILSHSQDAEMELVAP